MGTQLIDYRGINVVDPPPVGLGGLDIDDSFRELANRSGPIRDDTVDPGVNDDSDGTNGKGKFYQFSKWYNTASGAIFMCAVATPTAAVWLQISNSVIITEVVSEYTVLIADNYVVATGTFTVNLPPLASAIGPVNISCVSGTITIDGDGSETINGLATATLTTNQAKDLLPTSLEWRLV